jgi:hypothetical protein
MIDQGLAGHAKIAVSMIRRHKPFVAPKKMNLLPIERRPQILGPEEFVNSLRGRAAGKANAKTSGRAGDKPATRQAKASASFSTSMIGFGVIGTSVQPSRPSATPIVLMSDNGNGYRSATIHAAATVHTAIHASAIHTAAIHAAAIYPTAVPDRGVSYYVRTAASIGPPVKARTTSSRD